VFQHNLAKKILSALMVLVFGSALFASVSQAAPRGQDAPPSGCFYILANGMAQYYDCRSGENLGEPIVPPADNTVVVEDPFPTTPVPTQMPVSEYPPDEPPPAPPVEQPAPPETGHDQDCENLRALADAEEALRNARTQEDIQYWSGQVETLKAQIAAKGC
jgi:hypothetical protein